MMATMSTAGGNLTGTFRVGEDRLRSTTTIAILDAPEPVRRSPLLSPTKVAYASPTHGHECTLARALAGLHAHTNTHARQTSSFLSMVGDQ